MKGISIIIITWNKREMLKKSLTHIFDNRSCFCEVVLVDNGSTDGTAEMVGMEFPQIRLIRLHKNTGVPEARNIGAVNAVYDLLFFYDDDARLEFSKLSLVQKQMENSSRVAAATFNVIHLPHADIFSLDMAPFCTSTLTPKEAHIFKGGATIIKKHVYFETGMLPDRFFYCSEEIDMSFRLIKAGYDILYYDDVVVLHEKDRAKWTQNRYYYYHHRNRLFVIWKYMPLLPALTETAVLFGSGFLGGLLTSNFRAFCKGFFMGIAGLPSVLLKEREAMSHRSFGDYKTRYKSTLSPKKRVKSFFHAMKFRRSL